MDDYANREFYIEEIPKLVDKVKDTDLLELVYILLLSETL